MLIAGFTSRHRSQLSPALTAGRIILSGKIIGCAYEYVRYLAAPDGHVITRFRRDLADATLDPLTEPREQTKMILSCSTRYQQRSPVFNVPLLLLSFVAESHPYSGLAAC
jgi:hypothetical protein